jgi:hypothetical protein
MAAAFVNGTEQELAVAKPHESNRRDIIIITCKIDRGFGTIVWKGERLPGVR